MLLACIDFANLDSKPLGELWRYIHDEKNYMCFNCNQYRQQYCNGSIVDNIDILAPTTAFLLLWVCVHCYLVWKYKRQSSTFLIACIANFSLVNNHTSLQIPLIFKFRNWSTVGINLMFFLDPRGKCVFHTLE